MHAINPRSIAAYSPFLPDNTDRYRFWRDAKLKDYPTRLDELIVEIGDPRQLRPGEFEALHLRCRKANMAIYAGTSGTDPDPEIPLSLGRRFGVYDLNKNWLADTTGLTSLKVAEDGTRTHYIPYTNKAIHWHTDGYYNSANGQIQALNLHVVQRAESGGENALLDHEILYILLREQNPEHIHALMFPDAMTIPARIEAGRIARKQQSGPVFSITATGDLHMRYTRRADNVIWSPDPQVSAAVAALEQILDSNSAYIYRGLLQPGMGLISNNVLHDRAAFSDSPEHKRHYYRARYYHRLAGTGVLD